MDISPDAVGKNPKSMLGSFAIQPAFSHFLRRPLPWHSRQYRTAGLPWVTRSRTPVPLQTGQRSRSGTTELSVDFWSGSSSLVILHSRKQDVSEEVCFWAWFEVLPRPAKKHRDCSRELVECPFNTEPFRSFGRPGHGVTFVVSHFASDEATWLGLLSLPGDGSGPLTLQRASPVGAPRMPAPPFAVHGRAISHLVGARRPTGCAGQSDVSSSRILLGRSIPVFLALLVRNSAR